MLLIYLFCCIINAGLGVVILVMAKIQQAFLFQMFCILDSKARAAPCSAHVYIAANAIFKAAEDIL